MVSLSGRFLGCPLANTRFCRPGALALTAFALLLSVNSGCGPEFSVPDDATIACRDTSECPSDRICKVGRCWAADANQAPVVVVGAIARSVSSIEIPVQVFDAEGDDVDLAVALEVAASDDGGGAGVGTPIETIPAAVVGSAQGTAATLSFAAATHFASDAYQPHLWIHITPSDGKNEGVTANSAAFAFGNDAPHIQEVAFDGGRVSGNAVVRLRIDDSASDAVEISSFEVSPTGDFTDTVTVPLEGGAGQSFPSGSLTGIATSAAGNPHSVTWNTSLSVAEDAQHAVVRVKVRDGFGAESLVLSSAAFEIDNLDHAPVLALSAPPGVPAPGATVSGDVRLAYTLVDADEDPSLLIVDVWDAAATPPTWVPASMGEGGDGFRDLASSTTERVFVWSSLQLGNTITGDVQLRFQAFGYVPSEAVMTASFTVDNRLPSNVAPVVAIGEVGQACAGRCLGTVPVPFLLNDANFGDTIAIGVDYRLDGACSADTGWLTANPALTSCAREGLTNGNWTFVWDATADLATIGVGTATGTDTVLAPQANVCLRISPTDDSGDPATAFGLPDVSARFAVGNKAPVLTIAALEGETGAIAVGFFLEDASADLAGIDVEFRFDGDDDDVLPEDLWRRAKISLGAMDALATDPLAPGRAHVVVWDSLTASDDTHPENEQGIGTRAETAVEIRLRAHDGPAAAVTHFGEWQVRALNVSNQSPPRIEGVYIKSDGGGLRVGAIPIVYRLVDEQSDAADIEVESSRDGGSSWWSCTEYRQAASEGRYGLAAAPGGSDGGGRLHVFTWESTADMFYAFDKTLVRMRAASTVGGVGPWTLVLPASWVGPPDGVGFGSGSLPFPDSGSYSEGFDTLGGEAGDLNGDGALDIVFGEKHWTSVAVSLGVIGGDGVATGSFDRATLFSLPSGNQPRDVTLADLDGDGQRDAAVAACAHHIYGGMAMDSLRVMLGDGSGNLITPAQIFGLSAGDCPRSIVTADLNQDTIADLIMATSMDPGTAGSGDQGSSVSIFYGEGSAAGGDWTLLAPLDYATEPAVDDPRALVTGDFNEDGILDLAVANGSMLNLVILVGNGAPHWDFTPLGERPGIADLSAALVEIFAEDMNVDGHLDLAVMARGSDDALVVFSGTGDGAFTVAARTDTDVLAESFALLDLTGNGTADVVTANGTHNDFLIGLAAGADGRGTGDFTWNMSLSSGATTPRNLVIGDFNGDNILDFASGPSNHGGIYPERFGTVFLSEPGPPMMADHLSPSTSYSTRVLPSDFALADVDADGIVDAVFPQATTAAQILRGRGQAGVGDGTFLPPADGPTANWDIVVPADINGDWLIDLVFADGGSVTTFLATTPGVFSTPIVTGVGSWLTALALADMNRDGILDVVGAYGDTTSGTSIYVWPGNGSDGVGDGSFAGGVFVGWQQGANPAVAVGDFTGDGLLDVASVADGGAWSQFRVYGQDGGAPMTFSPVPQTCGPDSDGSYCTFAAGAHGMATADLTGDGVLDLVLTTNDGLTLLPGLGSPGRGNGDFDVVSLETGPQDFGVDIGDVDGDGILDLLVGRGQDGSDALRLWPGQSSLGVATGSFGPSVAVDATSVRRTGLADFNGDGMLDVAYSLYDDNRMGVRTGRQTNRRAVWVRPLRGLGSDNLGNVLGAMGLESVGLDAFGVRETAAFGLRRLHHLNTVGSGDPRSLPTNAADFRAALGHSDLTYSPALVYITDAWHAVGDVRLTRVSDPHPGDATDTGERLRVEARMGPRALGGSTSDFSRIGLDLSSTALDQERGVIVDLPILLGRSDTDIGDGSGIHVFARVTDYVRANEVCFDPMVPQGPCDLLGAPPEAALFLPRIQEDGAWRDVIIEKARWIEIPPGSFTDASLGPRFVLDRSGKQGERRIRVLTDRLGTFQAFVEP